MTRKSWSNKKLSNQRIDRNIIKRWGEKKDIIGSIILLCSKSSSFITGSEITIDGGFLLMVYKKPKFITIIPARGGSGIKKKNLIKICNKPLLYWSIIRSLKSKY